MHIAKLTTFCNHWCSLPSIYIIVIHLFLEIDIAVKWNLWIGKNKSLKEGTVLILSQKRIYFHWWYDDPIFSFPKYHSLNSEAAYSLIFSASLSCFLLEIVLLKADIFLIVVWFPTFYIIKIMHASTMAYPCWVIAM